MFSFYLISSSNSFRYFKEEILNRAVENQTNLKQIADEKLSQQVVKLSEQLEDKRKQFE